MKARSPGKLILSGEHAVVYGCPALAIAVDRYAEAEALPIDHPQLVVRLGDRDPVSWPLAELSVLASEIDARHHAFTQGEASIEAVLSTHEELFAYCAALVFASQALPQTGIQLSLRSEIPLGCGMGSSAALILASLRALAGHALSNERVFGLQAEHLQHGRSSGLDLHASGEGGLIRYVKGEVERLPPPQGAFRFVHTGCPEVSTGVCVQAVREQFGEDQALWQAFADCTKAFEGPLRAGSTEALREPIRENHRLLVRIGVVPERVQAFIAELEASGGAAKICGAGAIKGDTAGMVYVYGEGEDVDACIHKHYNQGLDLRVAEHGTEER